MNMPLLNAIFLLLQFLFQCLSCQFSEQTEQGPEEATEVFFIKDIL